MTHTHLAVITYDTTQNEPRLHNHVRDRLCQHLFVHVKGVYVMLRSGLLPTCIAQCGPRDYFPKEQNIKQHTNNL